MKFLACFVGAGFKQKQLFEGVFAALFFFNLKATKIYLFGNPLPKGRRGMALLNIRQSMHPTYILEP